ncbi:MAG TPA: DUF1003 domain-containing protein [Steroidobacteraceae bacterium]
MSDEQKPDRSAIDSAKGAASSLSDRIDQNIETMAALERRDSETTSASQRLVERMSRVIGRPAYLFGLLIFVVVWVGANVGKPFGIAPFDPPPFELLDGILTFSALVTATVVLIAQNRQTRREHQHRHLDLQLSLLTEQKVTKLIHLVEELRRDLPMVKDRDDPQAMVLQEATDTAAVISAMDESGLTKEGGHEPDRSAAKGRGETKEET